MESNPFKPGVAATIIIAIGILVIFLFSYNNLVYIHNNLLVQFIFVDFLASFHIRQTTNYEICTKISH